MEEYKREASFISQYPFRSNQRGRKPVQALLVYTMTPGASGKIELPPGGKLLLSIFIQHSFDFNGARIGRMARPLKHRIQYLELFIQIIFLYQNFLALTQV